MGFQDISVDKFRGIDKLKIEDFKQINLIAGCNNSGKSSILEALFLLTGMSSPELSVRINNFRDFSVRDIDDLTIIFYNLDTTKPISLSGSLLFDGEEKRNLSISPLLSNVVDASLTKNINDLEQLNSLNTSKQNTTGLNLNYSIRKLDKQIHQSNSKLVVEDGGVKAIRQANYTEKLQSIFISSKFAFNTVVERLDQIINNKQDTEIVDVLKSIEPKISRISISANRVIKVDVGLQSLIPINVMGDGIRKLLTILTAIYEVRGGLILVDEIDNGLHFSALKTLWRAIIIASRKFNVQIFATTHNIETLKYLKDTVNENFNDYSEEIRYYSLKKFDSGEVKSYKYDFQKFEYALEQGIEIR